MSLLFKYNYGNLKPKFQIKKTTKQMIFIMFIDQKLFSRIFDVFRSEYYSSNSFALGEKKSTSKQVLLDGSKD